MFNLATETSVEEADLAAVVASASLCYPAVMLTGVLVGALGPKRHDAAEAGSEASPVDEENDGGVLYEDDEIDEEGEEERTIRWADVNPMMDDRTEHQADRKMTAVRRRQPVGSRVERGIRTVVGTGNGHHDVVRGHGFGHTISAAIRAGSSTPPRREVWQAWSNRTATAFS